MKFASCAESGGANIKIKSRHWSIVISYSYKGQLTKDNYSTDCGFGVNSVGVAIVRLVLRFSTQNSIFGNAMQIAVLKSVSSTQSIKFICITFSCKILKGGVAKLLPSDLFILHLKRAFEVHSSF